MQKESMSIRQLICCFVLFLFGSSVVFGVNSTACHDSWISIILGGIMFVPYAFIATRVMKLNSGKNLCQAVLAALGDFWGRTVLVLYCLYGIFLSTLVVKNYVEFVTVVSMTRTPAVTLIILFLIAVLYLAMSGIRGLGKWSVLFFILIIVVMSVTIVLGYNYADWSNLLPPFEAKPTVIFEGALKNLAFPYLETIAMLSLMYSSSKTPSIKKVLLCSIGIGVLMLTVIFVRNLVIIGAPLMKESVYPSYQAARIVRFGDFISRIEGTISFNLIAAGITKTVVCVMFSAQCAKEIFRLKSMKTMIIPAVIAVFILSISLGRISPDLLGINKYYTYYALPIQLIPLIIVWIASEIKNRRNVISSPTDAPLF